MNSKKFIYSFITILGSFLLFFLFAGIKVNAQAAIDDVSMSTNIKEGIAWYDPAVHTSGFSMPLTDLIAVDTSENSLDDYEGITVTVTDSNSTSFSKSGSELLDTDTAKYEFAAGTYTITATVSGNVDEGDNGSISKTFVVAEFSTFDASALTGLTHFSLGYVDGTTPYGFETWTNKEIEFGAASLDADEYYAASASKVDVIFGTRTLSFVQTDTVGGTATVPHEFIYIISNNNLYRTEIAYDNDAPAITITGNTYKRLDTVKGVAGEVVTGNAWTGSAIRVTFADQSGLSGINSANTYYNFYDCNLFDTTCSGGANTALESGFMTATTGTYVFTLTDNAGNTMESKVYIQVDTTAPTLTVTSSYLFANYDEFTAFTINSNKWIALSRTSFGVSVSYSDPESQTQSATITIYRVNVSEWGFEDGNVVKSTTNLPSLSIFDFGSLNLSLPAGVYKLVYRVSNNVGMSNEAVLYMALTDADVINNTIFEDMIVYQSNNRLVDASDAADYASRKQALSNVDISLSVSSTFTHSFAGTNKYVYCLKRVGHVGGSENVSCGQDSEFAEHHYFEINNPAVVEAGMYYTSDTTHVYTLLENASDISAAASETGVRYFYKDKAFVDGLYTVYAKSVNNANISSNVVTYTFAIDNEADSLALSDVISSGAGDQYASITFAISSLISNSQRLYFLVDTKDLTTYEGLTYQEVSAGAWNSADSFANNEISIEVRKVFTSALDNCVYYYYADAWGNLVYGTYDLSAKFNFLNPSIDFDNHTYQSNNINAIFSVSHADDFAPYLICYSWETTSSKTWGCNSSNVLISGTNNGLTDYEVLTAPVDEDHKYLHVYVKDVTGQYSVSYKEYNVDIDNPVISIDDDSTSDWHNGEFFIDIDVNDHKELSELQLKISVEGGLSPLQTIVFDSSDILDSESGTVSDFIKVVVTSFADDARTYRLTYNIDAEDSVDFIYANGSSYVLELRAIDMASNYTVSSKTISIDRESDDLAIEGEFDYESKSYEFSFVITNSLSPVRDENMCFAKGTYDASTMPLTNCGLINNAIKDEGAHTFYIKDDAGNVTILVRDDFNIDKQAPTITLNQAQNWLWSNENYYSNSTVGIVVIIEDETSNLDTFQYAVLPANKYNEWHQNPLVASDYMRAAVSFKSNPVKVASVIVTVESDGIYYIIAVASDVFGNTATTVLGPDIPEANRVVRIDTIAPTVGNDKGVSFKYGGNPATDVNGYYNDTLTIMFDNVIESGSGKNRVFYKLSAESDTNIQSLDELLTDPGTVELDSTSQFKFDITVSGRYKIFYAVEDVAGNVSSLISVKEIYIDKDKPVATLGDRLVSEQFVNRIERMNIEDDDFEYTDIMDVNRYVLANDDNEITKEIVGAVLEIPEVGHEANYLTKSALRTILTDPVQSEEDERSFYLHLKVTDIAGNYIEEYYMITITTSVPPIIVFNPENLLDRIAEGTVKLMCGNEECNLNEQFMPTTIYIAIGSEFVPTLNAYALFDGIQVSITNRVFFTDLEFNTEGASMYTCFESPADSKGNVAGNKRLCSEPDEFTRELSEYYQLKGKDKYYYLTQREYLDAVNNRIELKVVYLQGPYLTFDRDLDVDNVREIDSQYIGVYHPYQESGVYYTDINGLHELFLDELNDDSGLISYEVKKLVISDFNVNDYDTKEKVINELWNNPSAVDITVHLENITFTTNGDIYIVRYYETSRPGGVVPADIYRIIQVANHVPVISADAAHAVDVDNPWDRAVNATKEQTKWIIEDYYKCYIDSSTECQMFIEMWYKVNELADSVLVDEEEYKTTTAANSTHFIDTSKTGIYILYLTGQATGITSARVMAIITVADKIGPIISMETTGGAVNVIIGYDKTGRNKYLDKGATAYDAIDGEVNVAKEITFISSTNPNESESDIDDIDVSRLGTYIITYSARDRSGNETTARRYIYVIDKDVPTVTFAEGSLLDDDGEEYYVIERSNKKTVNEIRELFIKGVADNYNDRLTISSVKVMCNDVECTNDTLSVNTNRIGNYEVTFVLSDEAETYNPSMETESIGRRNNVFTKKVIVKVVDTVAPTVKLYYLDPIRNNIRVYIDSDKVYSSLPSGVGVEIDTTKEYGDAVRLFVNDKEQDYESLGYLANEGYYKIRVEDAAGNSAYANFALYSENKDIAIYSDTLELINVKVDTSTAKFSAVSGGKATVVVNRSSEEVKYKVGDTLVVSYYDKNNRFVVLKTIGLTANNIETLSYDDLGFITNVEEEGVDYVFSFVLDAETAVKLKFIEKEKTTSQSSYNITQIAILGGSVVALIGILLFFRIRSKKRKSSEQI